jgi:HSP20 family protein
MEEALDRLFGATPRPHQPVTSPMPIDVSEKDNRLWIRAAVPGIDPANIEVTVENGVLTIQGSTSTEEIFEGAKLFRQEIFAGKFSRSIRLAEGYDLENIEAQAKNGIILISVPKLVEEKPKSLRIPIRTESSEVQVVNE